MTENIVFLMVFAAVVIWGAVRIYAVATTTVLCDHEWGPETYPSRNKRRITCKKCSGQRTYSR